LYGELRGFFDGLLLLSTGAGRLFDDVDKKSGAEDRLDVDAVDVDVRGGASIGGDADEGTPSR
jgi:hypothetical protein